MKARVVEEEGSFHFCGNECMQCEGSELAELFVRANAIFELRFPLWVLL